MAERVEISSTLKREIIETARSLFNAKGFDQTTVSDITQQLNINDRMIFYHFASLDEILEVVWSE